MSSYDLSGKAALVTGCGSTRGIGHALASRLAKDGADVAVADLCKEKSDSDKNWKGLAELVEKIEGMGRRAVALNADITDTGQVEQMIKDIDEAFGRLDIVCNNAGAAFGINLSYMISPDEWRKMLEINLTGTFLVSSAAARYMTKKNNGGSIINTASWRGRSPAPFMAAYCVAKAGVISLTECMALELAASKIRVNAICPGKVRTEMEEMGWQLKADAFGKSFEDIVKEEEGNVPLGRIAAPDDVANLVAFLASDDSDYITGQAHNFTGGMSLVNVR